MKTNKNIENKKNDRTPYEDVVLNKSATNFFNAFPVIKKAPVFKYYKRMLSLIEKQFLQNEVCSGMLPIDAIIEEREERYIYAKKRILRRNAH